MLDDNLHPAAPSVPVSNRTRAAVWIVQTLLFITFVGTGIWKVATPIPELAKKIPWAGQVSPRFLYATAVFDFLGGLGVLTRIATFLTPVAALGCAALQLCAVVFHFSRGEGANTPFNFLLIGLSLFVFWARRKR